MFDIPQKGALVKVGLFIFGSGTMVRWFVSFYQLVVNTVLCHCAHYVEGLCKFMRIIDHEDYSGITEHSQAQYKNYDYNYHG